jgi:non-specific serine/threonine protein kinase
LGLQAGADLLDDLDYFGDGVFFVNLAPIAEPGLVVSTIAQTLGVKDAGGQPVIENLKSYLKDKRLLLLLDNFEQVLGAAPAISELLSATTGTKVLVTSRAALHIRGEKEHLVSPLSLPDPKHLPPAARLEQYEAVRLFIERATDVTPGFEVTNENAPAVAEICARLDGLPLAIELAAARIKILPPQAMLSRLDSRLKLLTGGARDLPARQQTIRNTIEWSYDLLDERERRLFRRLGVFKSGSSLQAIEEVCNAERDLGLDVLDEVHSLVDKSLLRQVEGAGGEPRFLMLETILEFSREKLEESGEGDGIRMQHAAFLLKLVEEAEAQLRGPHQVEWLDRIEMEHDNVRTALGWCKPIGQAEWGLRMVAALYQFWIVRGYYSEGGAWFAQMLSLPGGEEQSKIRAWALHGAGRLATRYGKYADAAALYEEGLSIFRRLGINEGIANVLDGLASITWIQGDQTRARAYFEESLALSRELGDNWLVAGLLNNIGELERGMGNYSSASAYYEEAMTIQRQVGEHRTLSVTLANLGQVLQRCGDYGRATELLKEGLIMCAEIDFKETSLLCLSGLAGVASDKDPQRSAILLASVQALRGSMDLVFWPTDRENYDYNLSATRARLDEAAWQAAWAEGRAMSMEQVIAYALEDDESPDKKEQFAQ